MKRLLLISSVLWLFIFYATAVLAQAPSITYSTPQVYTTGTAISTLSPSNTGGAVSASSYSSVSNFFGALWNAYGVATDASGNVYAIDNYSGAIYKRSSSNASLNTNTTTASNPTAIIVDGLGNVYVSDNFTDKVYKFNSSLTLVSTISGFSNPNGLSVDASNNVYVADYSNNKIYKIAAGTTTATTFLSGFNQPFGVTVDASGNTYVSQLSNNSIIKVANGSTTHTTFATGFNQPAGLVHDAAGNIFVADFGNGAIKKITPAGTVSTLTTTGVDGPVSLAFDPSGYLYESDDDDGYIKKSNTGGYTISTTLPAGLSFNTSTGQITGTPTGTSASTNYTITAYNSGGTSSFVVNITVNAAIPAAPTAAAVNKCGAGAITITAAGGTPTGGTYNWYSTATGGTALQSSTSKTYTPTIVTTTTFYVSYTSGGSESARTAVTATINPIVSSPMSGAIFSYPFTGNANDVSGSNNNGTVQNGATLTTDRYGVANSAYSFNGTNQTITTTTQTPNPGPQTFTISLWFNTTTTTGGRMLGYGSSQVGPGGQYDRHVYMTNAGLVYFGTYNSGFHTVNTTASYNDGKWHHVIAIESATTGQKLYVDGVLQASNAANTASEPDAGYWKVGGDDLGGWPSAPTSTYFQGTLDDIAVYNRELSTTEIASSNDINQIGYSPSPACIGNPIVFSSPTITGATYTWQDAAGTTVTGQNPTFTSAVNGSYTLTVTGGPGGCSSTATITPTFNPAPSSTFTATPSVDVGANATITYTGTDPSTSGYAWTFTGGTPSSGSTQGPFSVQWSTSGPKTITLTVTNANGCQSTSTQTVNVAATTYGNYTFRRTVTLNNAAVGITSNLSNFPVLLSIQNNDLKIAGTCADKVYSPNGPNYDFAFVDPTSGNEMYYQIESYDKVNGILLVWVQVPTLTYASNNTILFYYGSISPPVPHNTAFFAKTWSTDYQVVFHFNDAYNGTNTADGTANNRNATLTGFAPTDLVAAGKIGQAYNFGGNNNMFVSQAPATTAFTLSAWIKLTTANLDQKIMTSEGATGLSSGGYKLGVYTDNTAETEDGGDVNRGVAPIPPTFTTGVWHYVQGVYDGTTLSTYVDGVQYRIMASTKNVTTNTTLYIGIGEGLLYPFNGVIDEPRVSNVAKTTDWIKMEYTDQNNPVSFTSVSSTAIVNTTNGAAQPGALTYTWTGATSTDPSVATNWTNTTAGISNQLPAFTGGTATLVIPTGLAKYPSLTADISVYGLTVASGASLSLNGHVMSVGCNIYNSSTGTIKWNSINTSAITWNGTTANQTYNGSTTAATAQLGSMTINNAAADTVTINSGPMDIYNQLTITKGYLAVATSPAALTLKSTSALTASVNPIPTAYKIIGTVNVERYITGGAGYRGYRFLSSPVYQSTTSVALGSNNVYSINYLKTYCVLTGTTGTTGGFDQGPNPTLYLFRENLAPLYTTFLNSNFRGVNNITTTPTYSIDGDAGTYNIPVGNGVLFFFRGDRTAATLAQETTPTYTSPVAVTLVSSGTLNQGPITIKDWYTPTSGTLGYTSTAGNTSVQGYNLVGNPYASSIDWETYGTSATSGISVNNVGISTYSYNAHNKNYAVYSKGGGGVGTNGATNIIASGQGFFVAATGTGATLTFNESAKSTAQLTSGTTLLMGKPTDVAQLQYLRLQLAKDSINTDDMVVRFVSSASPKYVSNEDAPYRTGFGVVSLCSISSNNVDLAINELPFPKAQPDVIGLNVNATADGLYSLNLTQIVSIPQLYDIWLMDAYKKDSLDMRHNPTYAFNVLKSDTNSFGSKRFTLVIRENPGYAYHLLNFTAAKTAAITQVQIVWKTENEGNYTNFTVERSTDGGKTYEVIGSQTASDQGTYSLLDKSPVNGQNLYRLKQVDLNGTVTYSQIIPVMYSDKSNTYIAAGKLNVYPNPATSLINLTIADSTAQSSYFISITNSLGMMIKQATSVQSTWETAISNLLPGTYIIQVVDNKDKSLIGKTKFVKL